MDSDPDSSASRFYYSAFYAVSALFAIDGKTFKKHSAVETAVHRDLVKTGRWTAKLGDDYSFLRGAREMGDYGGTLHVLEEEIESALQAAVRILEAVHKENSKAFPLDWGK
jgi:uncharacterized protein (UPF0332 family)